MAPLTWTHEVWHTTRVPTHGSTCTAPKRFTVVFEKNTVTYFCLLSKEACLYAGADWLAHLSVEGDEKSHGRRHGSACGAQLGQSTHLNARGGGVGARADGTTSGVWAGATG